MADQSFRIKNGLKVQDVLVINEQGSIASADRLPEIPISKIANLQTALDEKSSATALEGVYDVTEYTDVQNETTFEIAYDVGLVQVLYNGVQLAQSDFTATDGENVILDAAVESADDVITIIRWGAVAESSIIVETPTANTAVKRTSTGAIRSANGVNSDEVVTKAQLDLKANLASPTLTGTPAAPTANAGTNTTQIATTAFVQTAVSALVDTAPETLDTLNELAAALGDDPNFATTVSNSIGTKLDANTWNNSAASGITSTQVTNWDTAYGWGNHGSAGYAPANTTVTTNTTQTISGAKSLTSDLTLGFGGSYEDLILKTDTIISGYNGTFSITPRTVPGSGAASQLTYFKNNISGAGTTRHDVSIDGNVGIGTSSPGNRLVVGHESHGVAVDYLGASALPSIAGIFTDDGTNGGQGYGSLQIKARSDYSGYSINFFTAAVGGSPTEKMRLTSAGNLGIGTSSPAYQLEISNDNSGTENKYASLGLTSDGYGYSIQGGIVQGQGGHLRFMRDNEGSLLEVMRLDNVGNVGIGTSSPSAKLNVAGNLGAVIGSGGSCLKLTNTDTGNYASIGAGLVGATDVGMDFSVDGTRRMVISGAGNVGIGTSNPTSSLHVNHPNADVEVKLTSSTGAYSSKLTLGSAGGGGSAINATGASSSALFFQIDNSSRMMINSSGSVGIGTSSPAQKFSVDGGSIKLNHGNASTACYLWLNKKEGFDGGILLQRDNELDWQIQNLNTTGNLGFYSYGAGSQVVLIERASGNVGIGTTAPSERLSVEGSHISSKIRLTAETGQSGTDSSSILSMWASEPGETYNGAGIGENVNGHPYYGVVNSNRGAAYIRFRQQAIIFENMDSAGTKIESARFVPSGSLGIGTNSPSAKVHISGVNAGAALDIQSTGTGGRHMRIVSLTGGTGGLAIEDITASNAKRIQISSAGQITMPYQPAFRALLSTATNLASGVNGDVGGTFSAPLNVGGHYNTANRRFTAPVSGSYAFSAIIATVGGTGEFSYLSAEIWVNGARAFVGGWGGGGPSYGQTCTTSVIYLNAGDYVTLGCETNKGFTMQGVSGDQQHTSLSGYLIG